MNINIQKKLKNKKKQMYFEFPGRKKKGLRFEINPQSAVGRVNHQMLKSRFPVNHQKFFCFDNNFIEK